MTKDELIAALRTLTSSVVSCSFPLGSPPPNPGDVSVTVAGAAIPRDSSGVNGWSYADATNMEVRVSGSWCNAIMTSGRAAVRIVYGCSTGAGGASGTGGGPGTSLFAENFEDGDDNGWITDVRTSLGAWTVVTDGGNQVYQQGAADSVRTLSVGGAVGWTDQRVDVKVKFPTLSAAGGRALVAARVRDLANYYFVRLDPTGQISIGKRLADAATTLVTARNLTPLAAGTWYTLSLDVKGTTLTAYLDGTSVATIADADLATGGIAVGTERAITLFDDVRVTTP